MVNDWLIARLFRAVLSRRFQVARQNPHDAFTRSFLKSVAHPGGNPIDMPKDYVHFDHQTRRDWLAPMRGDRPHGQMGW